MKLTQTICLLSCVFVLCVSTFARASDIRTALVIGNGAYEAGPLKNPVNDGSDVAAVLKRLGFKVTLKLNASHRDMEEAVMVFGEDLKKRGGAGLFYFAGHGMQVSGVNYLIPVKARIEKDSDLRFEAVNADRILAEMENAGNNLNFILLDACRDNPFARSTRSSTRGLTFVGNAPSGTFISYSTGANQVANDGDGRNSPYTAALLKYIEEPGLTVEEMFKKVRQELRQTTGQVPWELSSLEGRFYFNPPDGAKTSGHGSSTQYMPQTFVSGTLGATFTLIQKGTFTMGSPDDEQGRNNDEQAHRVTLSSPFYMQATEVTQGQWKKVMGENPSYSRYCGNDCPVENVSWDEVQAFIQALNKLEKTTAYRLPTEAQWEYTARAGSSDAFCSGTCLSAIQANFNGLYAMAGCPRGNNSRGTVKTKSFSPNPWGLFDMHGNVREWVSDWKGDYPHIQVIDPIGPSSGTLRITRGGSWQDSAKYCRCAYRGTQDPTKGRPDIGFRLIRIVDSGSK